MRKPFPRSADPGPMNRRLHRKAARRHDLHGIVRYGLVPAATTILRTFESLPAAVRETAANISRLTRLLTEDEISR